MARGIVLILLLAGCSTADAGMVPTTQATTTPATRPSQFVHLSTTDAGQLYPQVQFVGGATAGGICWSFDEETQTGDLENSRPTGYFDGRAAVRMSPGRVEVTGWRYTHRSWQITALRITQAGQQTEAEWTVRTPAGMPDWTFTATARHTAELLRAIPELRRLLDDLLSDLGAMPYDEGPFVRAVETKTPPPGWVTEKVNDLLPDLGRDWRTQERAEDVVRFLGWEAALALWYLPMSELTPQQAIAVERLKAEWPKAE